MIFACLTGEQLALLATSSAIAISRRYCIDDVEVLGNLLQTIGQNLSLIASQATACEDDSDDS